MVLVFTHSLEVKDIFNVENFGKMLIPYDADNQGCGSDAAVAQYPYIYFASPHSDVIIYFISVIMGNSLRFFMP